MVRRGSSMVIMSYPFSDFGIFGSMACHREYDIWIIILMYGYSDFFTDHWTKNHCDDHFYKVSRNKWKYTDRKCSGYCISRLEAEPCSSESIADCCTENHSKNLDYAVVTFINDDTCNDCHWNKSYNISTGWSRKFSNTSGKSGKYRKTYKSD